ncbi:MMPL family transporter [Gordonia neofelifaecis]|uniref:MMPL domain protein n=1 Tax=Gordonia neofelifaecis NRRL B-59395 TaxID=644548 RepID=F1YLZ7_9ACTN|nr:MMPL family transporter [Gordonia neofelifaecis]EGD54248.1 MMPL domain protein [Gordonia neofelifaecis NRRL B-59395]
MAHGPSRTFTGVGRFAHRHAWWILGFWVLAAVGLNLAIPQLEVTVSKTSADFLPRSLPANQHLEAMARDFGVPPSNAVSSVVLVDDKGFGPADDAYYVRLVDALTKSDDVAYLIDFYGKPVTREAALSPDGKAVNILVAAEGSVGSTRAHHAAQGIRAAIDSAAPPAGLQTYYTGPTATLADLFSAIDFSLLIITGVSILLISIVVFIVYRKVSTAAIPLISLALGLAIVRPIASLLGGHGWLSISNFTIAIMTALVLGAVTDYAIFTLASYHEGRRKGLAVGDAVASASGRTAPIIVASALTIAAASASMIFTRIGMFRTAGPPTAIAVLVVLALALTLPPALLSIAGRRGLAEPGPSTERRWRHRGATIMRRAGIYAAASLIFLVSCAALLIGHRTNWDESSMFVRANESTRGYDAVYRHYGVNAVATEYLIVRADHDVRNTSDLAALELAADAVSRLDAVEAVRSITRPDGKPLTESAAGYVPGRVGHELDGAAKQMADARPDLLRLASGVGRLTDGADEANSRMPELVAGTDQVVTMAGGVLDSLDAAQTFIAAATDGRSDLTSATDTLRRSLDAVSPAVADLRRGAAAAQPAIDEFDRVFAPLIAPRTPAACSADPRCAAARVAFDQLNRATGGQARATLSGLRAAAAVPGRATARAERSVVALRGLLTQLNGLLSQLGGRTPDQIRADLGRLQAGVGELSDGMSQLADGLHQVRDGTAALTALTDKLHAGLKQATGYLGPMSAATADGPGRGFYLPDEALDDPRMVEGGRLLISPSGHTARMMVTWKINPYSGEALAASRGLAPAARSALAGTGLADAEVSNTGLASLSADMNDQLHRDLLIFGLAAIVAVTIVLTVLLRSVVAPLVLVATVLLSFAAVMGISTLVWQHLIGIPLDWSVAPVAGMALIAVGADYSMLFASRIREESAGRGLISGVIRGFGSTGSVITTAGLVFAITMFALMSGTTLNLVQIGFTIGVGLLLDILVVRSILVPATIAVLGERMWWPAPPVRRPATDD